MRGKDLLLIIGGLILLNCLTVIYFLSKSHGGNGMGPTEKVATIGDQSISRQEWLNELEARYGKDVLKDMIDQQVISEVAAKSNILVSDNEVNQEFKMAQAAYIAPSKAIDEKKWKEQIKSSLLLEEILTKDVIVSNKEISSYYKKNKSQFYVPTTYHLSHILVKTKSEAKKAYQELSSGSSFSALAMERSTDVFSANQGGDIGFISEDDEQYPADYLKAAKDLKVGQWSKPIKEKQGYAIIKLHKVIKGKIYSYSEVKAKIRRAIAMEQIKVPISAQSFWDEAKVTWFYGTNQDK
ncbi:peptidyl-prolyl cis-trans isomerase [Bacillus sp. EB600]|uniref:peptidyl-prolyl cis-trans isomerase n=1 Tax=Bacillus sp. EB600 TaxID=2806345 RepID=UPI00210CFF66|nr:peptidyl-prolyl cis-trans isomerase [Bacillus sp. EB600]MCQ6281890.1 peptidyl-prolyl cis-trans isomerase [Bacillus sp. EB600]